MRQLLLVTAMLSFAAAGRVVADEVRYYEQNGVTYCETRRVVQQRVPQTRIEQRPQTVYRQEFATEVRETPRTYWTPVTEYQTQTYLAGRWNPFATPHFEYRTVPTVRWEQKTEVVRTPVTCQKLVPETKTVSCPVTTWQTIDQEVISRFAVTGRPSAANVASRPVSAPSVSTAANNLSPPATLAPPAGWASSATTARPAPVAPLTPVETPQVARRDQIGGVSRLDGDPPRQPTGSTVPSLLAPLRR